MDAQSCRPEEHSWRIRAGDFVFAGHRDGGGIANRVRRVCERCPAYSEQIEVTTPAPWRYGNADDTALSVEDSTVHAGPPPRAGRFDPAGTPAR